MKLVGRDPLDANANAKRKNDWAVPEVLDVMAVVMERTTLLTTALCGPSQRKGCDAAFGFVRHHAL